MRKKRDRGAFKEKVIRCGPYGRKAPFIEVEIYPNTEGEFKPVRHRKIEVSAPKQKRFNDRRAIRYLFQLIKANFSSGDYRVDLTYSDKFLPADKKTADKMITNYLDRIERRRTKEGLPRAAYICVTEYGKEHGRIHHHLLIKGGLSRDVMEALWCDRQRKGQKERESLGYVNCDRMQFTTAGIEGLSIYITKDMRRRSVTEGQLTLADVSDGEISIEDILPQGDVKGCRHWKQSKGLIKPWYTPPSDKEYSRRKVMQIIERYAPDSDDAKQIFERKYKGYALDRCYYEYNEFIGAWSISLRMHLKGHKP